jgi:uncharacterized membrane protein
MTAQKFFSKEEQAQIVEAIKTAENLTSGEIRVHIENHCKEDALDRTTFLFEKMEMHKTELRNGVLIYLALKDRKFSIIGDAGINAVVGDNFWEDIKESTITDFKAEAYCAGLCAAIKRCGEKLVAQFPVAEDDINELSDDISFGKN